MKDREPKRTQPRPIEWEDPRVAAGEQALMAMDGIDAQKVFEDQTSSVEPRRPSIIGGNLQNGQQAILGQAVIAADRMLSERIRKNGGVDKWTSPNGK